MVEFSVFKIEEELEFIGYQEYKLVNLIIPNLEVYGITSESANNFQTRLLYELQHMFWYPYIRIIKSESHYKYIIRVYDLYCLTKNTPLLETHVNELLNTFPFKRSNKKRKQLYDISITSKIKKLSID
jgi:hypothetical protein